MSDNEQKFYAAEGSSSPDRDGFEMRSISKLGGTEADEHDMQMLGRTQVLNRNFRFISTLGFACTLMSTWEIALMYVVLDAAESNANPSSDVLNVLQDDPLRAHERRHRRPDLGLPHSMDRIYARVRVHRRDGVHGAYLWRTVSLGVRVRAAEGPEVHQLHRR